MYIKKGITNSTDVVTYSRCYLGIFPKRWGQSAMHKCHFAIDFNVSSSILILIDIFKEKTSLHILRDKFRI